MNIDTVGKQKNSVRLRLIRLESNRNLSNLQLLVQDALPI